MTGWEFAPGNVPDGYHIHAALERVRELGGDAGEAQEIASGYMARCRDDQGTELNLWAPRGDS